MQNVFFFSKAALAIRIQRYQSIYANSKNKLQGQRRVCCTESGRKLNHQSEPHKKSRLRGVKTYTENWCFSKAFLVWPDAICFDDKAFFQLSFS